MLERRSDPTRPAPARLTLALALPLALPLALAGCSEGSGGGGDDNDLEILSKPATEAAWSQTYTYQLQTSLIAGPVTFALLEGPAGMTVDASGLVRWNPGFADIGSHTVRVEVSNPNESARQSFTLRVSQDLVMGTTLSPRGHASTTTAQDLLDFYVGHADNGQVVNLLGPWRDDVASAGQIPAGVQAGLAAAAQHGFTPMVGLSWTDAAGNPDLDGQTNATNSWFNAETRAEFVGLVTSLANNHQIPYLYLGNETNSYWLNHTQAEWDEWIDVFGEAYLAVKTVSPATMVFTTFQLEHMKGLGAATTGWTDPAHFQLIADHGTMIDAFGFTTYPYFEYGTPGAIPAGYYDEIATHWSGPVLFTETGWLAAAEGAFPGGVGDQGAFAATLFDRVQALDVEYVGWRWLHDFDAPAAGFATLGLRTGDGLTIRPADASWQSAVTLRQRR